MYINIGMIIPDDYPEWSLHSNISVVKCERIMIYPYVRLDESTETFEEFANRCANTWGARPEEWKQQNKRMLGLFGSKNKKLERGAKFKFPQCLVDDASERFFESVGIPSKRKKSGSPSSVVDNTSSPESINTPSPESITTTPSPDIIHTAVPPKVVPRGSLDILVI
jgi:hypothetical protein